MLHIVREGRSLNIPDSKDPVTDTAEDIDKEYVDKTPYSLCFMQAFFIKKNKSTKWVCFLKQIPNFHFTPLIFLFSSFYSSKSTKF